MEPKNTSKNNGNPINPVATLITGAIVGAGVAVAGVVLKEKKNREKLRVALNKAKNQAGGYVNDIRKNIEEKDEMIQEKLDLGNKGAKVLTNTAKKIAGEVKSDFK